MTELFEFGRHTPYILAAYSVSVVVIAALIFVRRRQLRKSLALERADRDVKN